MNKREQILQITTEIIALEGVNASPMSQIAKKAGVAVGTIYHHFKSKEEIIHEIYLNIKRNFAGIIAENKTKKLSFKDEFESTWVGIYSYFINNPIEFQFLQQVENSPIITEQIHKECEEYIQPIFEFYQFGIDNGIVIDMDVTLLSQLTFDNILTIVGLQVKGHDITDKILQQAVHYSWRGIAAK